MHPVEPERVDDSQRVAAEPFHAVGPQRRARFSMAAAVVAHQAKLFDEFLPEEELLPLARASNFE